jgi:hypothetical protein
MGYLMDCLTFTNESDAKKELDKINLNYGYPIQSINAKSNELVDFYTLRWANVKKADNDELWYFQKPETAKMIGIMNYIEKKYDLNWKQTTEELT